MVKRSLLHTVFWLCSSTALVVFFQNCSGSQLQDTTSNSQIGGGNSIDPGDPGNTKRICLSADSETENYQQPATTNFPAGVTFLTSWDVNHRAGGFRAIQAMDSCRMQYDPNFKTWHDKPATRVEVNPGDDPISSGGERAEVLFMQDPSGDVSYFSTAIGSVFVATSYYFPPDWAGTVLRGDSESWSLIMQFHDGGSGGYFAGIQAGLREQSQGQKFYYNGGTTAEFTDGSQIRLGEWVDFVLNLNFASGELKIYRRNQGETKFRLVLDIVDNSMITNQESYFKQGLYRGPSVNGRTDVLWIGPTARGNSFTAVEQAAFATANGY